MKEIKAYVRNNMVDGVVAALWGIKDVTGIAIVELKAYGHAAADGTLTMVEMTKLEVDVADASFDAVVNTVIQHARTGTGHPGDGRVIISEIADVIRIEDGARGGAILQTREPAP